MLKGDIYLNNFEAPAIEIGKRIDEKIDEYVAEVLAMVLPKDVTVEEQMKAKKLITDFTTLAVYKKKFLDAEKVSFTRRTSIEDNGFIEDFANLNAIYKELTKSKPRDLKNKLHFHDGAHSRYKTKLFNDNYCGHIMPIHRLNNNKFKTTRVLGPEELKRFSDNMMQMYPIVFLRDMFYSGYSSSKIDFDTMEYHNFEQKVDFMKRTYLWYLSNGYKLSNSQDVLSTENIRRRRVLNSFEREKDFILDNALEGFKCGISALDGMEFAFYKEKGAAKRDAKDRKDYEKSIYEGYINHARKRYSEKLREFPENRKERKDYLNRFNDDLIDDIKNTDTKGVDLDLIRKRIERFERKSIAKVMLGLSPLYDSYRSKDELKLNKTKEFQGKIYNRIQNKEDITRASSIIVPSLLVGIAATELFVKGHTPGPLDPLIYSLTTSAVLGYGNILLKKALEKAQLVTPQEEYTMSGVKAAFKNLARYMYLYFNKPNDVNTQEKEREEVIAMLTEKKIVDLKNAEVIAERQERIEKRYRANMQASAEFLSRERIDKLTPQERAKKAERASRSTTNVETGKHSRRTKRPSKDDLHVENPRIGEKIPNYDKHGRSNGKDMNI